MTPDQRIDDNIRVFLQSAGLVLHYPEVARCKAAVEAMRRIMINSYTAGVNSDEQSRREMYERMVVRK